jgi:hypothetical protein
MSTIFCDFRQFSAKKLFCFFSQKPMLWSPFLQNYLLSESKMLIFFTKFFCKKFIKIITSVPDGAIGRISAYWAIDYIPFYRKLPKLSKIFSLIFTTW